MADKYDERARELMPDCKCRGAQFYTCTLCDGTRERRCDREDIAAALRAAAEEERRAHAETLDLLLRVRASTQGQLISDPFASDLDEHLVKHGRIDGARLRKWKRRARGEVGK